MGALLATGGFTRLHRIQLPHATGSVHLGSLNPEMDVTRQHGNELTVSYGGEPVTTGRAWNC